MVHWASVGPICILEWSALMHMLSVMVPVNDCLAGGAARAAIASRDCNSVQDQLSGNPEGLHDGV